MSEESTGGGAPPVFLAPEVPHDGARTVLDGDEARHAATVRRLRTGEHLVLTDGAGAMAECDVLAVRTGREPELDLSVRERWTQPRPDLRVTVAQALVKGERGELAVELATEVGADAIVPWRAARSIARWDDGPRGQKALRRWRRTAESAAKQSRRGWIPEVREPLGTAGLAGVVGAAAGGVLLDADASTALSELPLPTEGELVLVVGPEGGINESERASLAEVGAHSARLGSTVLRASTAAAVALGALGARTARWG